MAEQQEKLRRRHEALEAEHAALRAALESKHLENERLESKLDHLEAVFVNSDDGTAGAFAVRGAHQLRKRRIDHHVN
eukprot:4617451-Pyramimonas_sp.AAC.1